MDVRKHPTHKRAWVATVILLVVLSLIALILTLSVHEQGAEGEGMFRLLSVAFLLLLSSAFIAMIAFSFLSRCPICGTIMSRYRSENQHRIQFICSKCDVVFDTGIEESED